MRKNNAAYPRNEVRYCLNDIGLRFNKMRWNLN